MKESISFRFDSSWDHEAVVGNERSIAKIIPADTVLPIAFFNALNNEILTSIGNNSKRNSDVVRRSSSHSGQHGNF
jgi:hypothetical protein